MDAKEFIRQEVKREGSQTRIARKIGVSIGTINNILYSDTQLTLETIRKIARAYGKPIGFFVSDNEAECHPSPAKLTATEERLLSSFRQLDSRRQERFLETIEDMVLALRESGGREGPTKGSEESNSGRRSSG